MLVAEPALPTSTQEQPSSFRLPRQAFLIVAVAILLLGAYFIPQAGVSQVFLAAGIGIIALAAVIRFNDMVRHRKRRRFIETVSRFVQHDASPSFTTNSDGIIDYQNQAALDKFGDRDATTLTAVLGGLFASPSAVLYRLQSKAAQKGAAREDVVLRRGHMRLSVHLVADGEYLWRLEDIADRGGHGRGAEGISIPMLTVSKNGAVLFGNDALRRLIGGRESTLDRIINDLPLRPGDVHEIATVDGPQRATVVEVESAAGRRELYMLPVLHGPSDSDWGLIDALPVPLLKVAPDGTVERSNQLARDMLEILPGEALSLGSLVDGLGRPVVDWLADAAQGRGLARPEFVKATNPSNDVHLQISLGRVSDKSGTSLVAVLNDATELKTLEAQFVQSQKMQAIGQLAGGVAHDFNNLLTAISGHCDLLLLRHDESDPNYADLEQINQNANRAASLVGQLVAFSRKQNLQPQVLDLRESLAELAHLLNRLVGEKIDLNVTHSPDLRPVRADKRQLEQVMMNLVVNARDAMPEGGEIRIETLVTTLETPLERDRAVVPRGDYVQIRVTDEGIGIPSEKLPKIFEPFFTSKPQGEGTGLGLSTAYGIIKQTGGFIFADSVVGQGTVFTIYLPAQNEVSQVSEVAPKAPAASEARSGDGVVLLVEDEAPVRAFASRALRMRGYTVIEAANAEEALETLEDNELQIDVFVTDVVMPGMDGPSWVIQALEKRPDTRVVFVSGYAEEYLTDSQAKIPNSVFLPKPFSLNELTNTVQDQLH